jgi:ubiquitin-like protein Pup
MSHEQIRRSGGNDDGEELEDLNRGGQEQLDKKAAETDELLDEIDDILEENAQDFVEAYVQKGGQ